MCKLFPPGSDVFSPLRTLCGKRAAQHAGSDFPADPCFYLIESDHFPEALSGKLFPGEIQKQALFFFRPDKLGAGEKKILLQRLQGIRHHGKNALSVIVEAVNAGSLEAAMSMVAGTARSMGVTVAE